MHIWQCARKCAKNVQGNVQKMCKTLVYTIQNNIKYLKIYKISASQQYYKTYSVSDNNSIRVQMTVSSAHVSPVYSLTLFVCSFCVGYSPLWLVYRRRLLHLSSYMLLVRYHFIGCSLPLSNTSSAQLTYCIRLNVPDCFISSVTY